MLKRLVLLLLPLSLGAQNWSPVNLSDRYNYRLENDAVITSTTWQTGFSVNGSDTLFSLNRAMCDSCLVFPNGPLQCDTCYGNADLPRFTGKFLLKRNDGWVNFRDPGSKTINLFAAVNDSWLFDTLAGVTASLIAADTAAVLGIPDSLKTILLSTGDTIRFSKDHGITQWPDGYGQNRYYRLAGIHGRNLGELWPRMKDYFDFNVGDMFEYAGHEDCGCSPQLKDFWRKYTINSKTISGDTIRYGITGYYMAHNSDVITWNTWWAYLPINETLEFIDSANHFGNYFNNEHIYDFAVYPNSGSFFYSWTTISPDYIDYRTMLTVDSLGLRGIRFGTTASYSDLWVSPSGSQPLNTGSDTLVPQDMGQAFAIELEEGLGQVFGKFSSNFEGSWGERLTAYRKNGDTVGVFTPDNVMDGMAEQLASSAVPGAVYPNPSNGNFTVQLASDSPAQVSLLDISGRTVKGFGTLQGTVSLSAAELADGVYILRQVSAAGITDLRLVIRH